MGGVDTAMKMISDFLTAWAVSVVKKSLFPELRRRISSKPGSKNGAVPLFKAATLVLFTSTQKTV
jgi:hypothetical protein